MKVSVVMATMNEAGCVEQMIDEIRQYTPQDTEIIIVDASDDETPKLAEKKGVKVLYKFPANGTCDALKYGIKEANGDIIATIDCDMTYQTSKLPEMIELIEKEGYDIVSGCRLTPQLKKEMPFINWFGNLVFAFIVRTLFKVEAHDVTTGMIAMKKEYAKTEWVGSYSLPTEMIIRSKFMNKKYKQIPIKYNFRVGKPKLPILRSGAAYLRCFAYWKFGLFKNGEK